MEERVKILTEIIFSILFFKKFFNKMIQRLYKKIKDSIFLYGNNEISSKKISLGLVTENCSILMNKNLIFNYVRLGT